jgi:NDP-sugar pyrophosphorylase family protein
MQAVILAAGRGTRMGDLTKNRPKPMLEVAGKNLIEWKLEALPTEVDEVIIIVGYLHQLIRDYFKDSFGGRSIRYLQQENIVGGTADALWQAKDMLSDRFIVMMGDDLYVEADIRACIAQPEWALLVQSMHESRSAGAVVVDTAQNILGTEEGEHHGDWLASTNLFVLDTRLFRFDPVPKAPGSSELGLPQTATWVSKCLGIPFAAVPATHWIQITAPEDMPLAEAQLSHLRPLA